MGYIVIKVSGNYFLIQEVRKGNTATEKLYTSWWKDLVTGKCKQVLSIQKGMRLLKGKRRRVNK